MLLTLKGRETHIIQAAKRPVDEYNRPLSKQFFLATVIPHFQRSGAWTSFSRLSIHLHVAERREFRLVAVAKVAVPQVRPSCRVYWLNFVLARQIYYFRALSSWLTWPLFLGIVRFTISVFLPQQDVPILKLTICIISSAHFLYQRMQPKASKAYSNPAYIEVIIDSLSSRHRFMNIGIMWKPVENRFAKKTPS